MVLLLTFCTFLSLGGSLKPIGSQELGPPKMNSSKSWESTSNWGGPGSGFQCQGHHHQPCPQPSFNNAPWISSWVAVAREILGSILGLAKSHVTISHCIDRFCTFLHYPCFPLGVSRNVCIGINLQFFFVVP